jgi:thiol-disulfide isomerase/thioredoxin
MVRKQNEMKSLQEQFKDTTLSEKQKSNIRTEINDLLNEKQRKILALGEENPDLMVTTFLKATLEVDVPEDIKKDRQAAYEYAKAHYFDNFDLADKRLLHTPLYEGKMNNYLDNMVIQIPDSINKEIDLIVEQAVNDSAIFRFVLISLFNKYAKSQIMGMDAVQVHIADKYYIDKAWWSDEKFLTDLRERVDILKPLLIGKIAPDHQLMVIPAEHFKKAANDTALKKYPHAGAFKNIHDVQAEYTVLVFWEPTCSHCKKVVPKLHNIYQNQLKEKNIEVLAINTLFGEDGKEKWTDFINKNELYSWINAWNPYDYKYKVEYDIRSTPQIYVLNNEKEIIGKKLGPENVLELIEAYKKIKSKE